MANIVPEYRRDFYERVMTSGRFRCTLFCQHESPGLTLNSIHMELPGDVRELSYLAFQRKKLVWQRLPMMYLWRHFDVYIFHGNPRVLSTVFWATLLRFTHRKVIIWGQVHTAGSSPRQEKIRLFWWKLFDYFFVYTDREVALLKSVGFDAKTVIGMNNGLNQRNHELQRLKWRGPRLEEWKRAHGLEERIVVLSCARLEAKNRFDLMIRCMPRLVDAFDNILWCVIGDGQLAPTLRAQAKSIGAEQQIRWLGAIYKEEELAPWFLASECLVHPGAIGLSLLHAFGYGLPVITHDNLQNHMPEISALRNGSNGLLYRENDPHALLETIIDLLRNHRMLDQMRGNARAIATTEFNTEIMASRFAELVQEVGCVKAVEA